MSNGKGDRQRPMDVSKETYARNWDRTFVARPERQSPEGQPNGFVMRASVQVEAAELSRPPKAAAGQAAGPHSVPNVTRSSEQSAAPIAEDDGVASRPGRSIAFDLYDGKTVTVPGRFIVREPDTGHLKVVG